MKENDIENYKLSENEIMVIKLDFDKYDVEQAFQIHKSFQKKFGKDKVITIPQDIYLQKMTKQELKKWLQEVEK